MSETDKIRIYPKDVNDWIMSTRKNSFGGTYRVIILFDGKGNKVVIDMQDFVDDHLELMSSSDFWEGEKT